MWRSSLCLSLLLRAISEEGAVQVSVYEGPTTCSEADQVKHGKQLSMHYTGKIDQSSATGTKGAKFDSSHDHGSTFDFQIGAGDVIDGWEQGLMGLCKGAKAILIIPPELGYGEDGAGEDIPGGATLNFDVEIVDISDALEEMEDPEDSDTEENLFLKLDTNGDNRLSKEEVEQYFIAEGDDMPPEVFSEEDTDGDGFISWEEFTGPKGEVVERQEEDEEL
eukprot:gnl/TRDRNA2_/TRDRNA2_188200_c0_seq1.p1 gnl/TRDRNA2_/TRDRNA2_188200_c0~~gnl/TRDRNA2_/TRDRNA2_188200_c0_seq1.p1  ORF type:complete len:221 (+),score=65.11 gnl/TRDRNA2_/TRDRNA2_188200_c0_seq1:57-719(+)